MCLLNYFVSLDLRVPPPPSSSSTPTSSALNQSATAMAQQAGTFENNTTDFRFTCCRLNRL